MTIAAALYAHLTANAAVSALVDTRVYPIRIPEAVLTDQSQPILPTITYRQTGRNDERPLSEDQFLARNTFEVTVWSEARPEVDVYAEVHDVADAVVNALDWFRGVMGGVGGVNVQQSRLVDRFDDERGLEADIYGVSLVFEIQYEFA